MSLLRKKSRLPSAAIKYSSKEVSFAEKTQVRVAPSLFAKVKHLVDVDSEKISSIRDILHKFPSDKLKTCNLPYT